MVRSAAPQNQPLSGGGLISEAYRAQQTALHHNPDYGVASVGWAPLVAEIVNQVKPDALLDYGAGKGRLGPALGPLVEKMPHVCLYDPAIPEIASPPSPAPVVACIDVLEHIEPDCLEAVLDDLMRVCAAVGVFTIATGPAAKTLPDGRNAHLIQQGPEWWMPKLFARFSVKQFTDQESCFVVIVTRKPVQ